MLSVAALLLAVSGSAQVSAQQTFSADATVGSIDSENAPTGNPGQVNQAVPQNIVLVCPKPRSIGTLPRLCGTCTKKPLKTTDIRAISNKWCAGGGANDNSFGMSNMGALFRLYRRGVCLSSRARLPCLSRSSSSSLSVALVLAPLSLTSLRGCTAPLNTGTSLKCTRKWY
jgi:hypothetical protein